MWQCTGPAEELAPLCAKLKDEGVFVRELDTLGIPYHSPALEPFSDKLRRVLTAVVGAPKERSAKWLSTCYPLNSEEPGSKLCGPDYHVSRLSPLAPLFRSVSAVHGVTFWLLGPLLQL